MQAEDYRQALDTLSRPRALVLGDLLLDAFAWGNVDRVSPEAPVLVLEVDRREWRVGGAGNVAHALTALDATAACAGVIGNDSEGQLLTDLLADCNVDNELILTDPSRRTTLKERFIGKAANAHPGHILRVDSEDRTPLAPWLENEIIAKLSRDITQYSVLLVADYGKGVCTPRVLEAALQAARGAGVPSIVDPVKSRDWNLYRGASVLLANRAETEQVSEHAITSPGEAMTAGRRVCQKYEIQTIIVTLNQDGMAIVRRDGTGGVFPTAPRQVYEITGVGDVVLAMLGLCAASGVEWEVAAPLANLAAGLVVEQFGPTVISRDQLRNTIDVLERLQSSGIDREQSLRILPLATPLAKIGTPAVSPTRRAA